MKQNYFSFYVFEPEYFDIFLTKSKALGHQYVPVRSEDNGLLFIHRGFVPFSDRPIKNDRLDTFILPIQDAHRALEHLFSLEYMVREVYFQFCFKLTWEDFPEDWMEKAFVKITTYADDLCKMRVELYLTGYWKRDSDNLLYGIYQGDTPRIDIPMAFTDDQTDSYGISEIRELRTGFKPNHTDGEIISLTTDEYTGATSITFKTPAANLEDMLWFTEDMMSSCDSDDMVTVQLTMENPAVRVVTNRVGVADKEPEDEDTADISEEDCVEDDEELSKLEAAVFSYEAKIGHITKLEEEIYKKEKEEDSVMSDDELIKEMLEFESPLPKTLDIAEVDFSPFYMGVRCKSKDYPHIWNQVPFRTLLTDVRSLVSSVTKRNWTDIREKLDELYGKADRLEDLICLNEAVKDNHYRDVIELRRDVDGIICDFEDYTSDFEELEDEYVAREDRRFLRQVELLTARYNLLRFDTLDDFEDILDGSPLV